MSYDSYISLKEAIEHAGVQSGISVKIEWIDDYLINGKEVPLKYFDGIIIGEGRNFINEKLFLIKYARKIKIPLLAISFGADLLIKEYCEEDLNVEVALEKNSELYLGSKMTKLSEKSKISEIYSSNDILERYRISKGLPNSIAKKISGSIAITGITSDNVPAVFEIPGEDFILGVRFHPEYTSRPGNPNPLILEFIKKCSSLKKKLAIEQIKILIAEKLR
jgi:CTP synthase